MTTLCDAIQGVRGEFDTADGQLLYDAHLIGYGELVIFLPLDNSDITRDRSAYTAAEEHIDLFVEKLCQEYDLDAYGCIREINPIEPYIVGIVMSLRDARRVPVSVLDEWNVYQVLNHARVAASVSGAPRNYTWEDWP